MKARSICTLCVVFTIAFLGAALGAGVLPLEATSAAKIGPNMLEIVSTPAVNGGEQANVTQAQLVQDIYHSLLSLPTQPTHKICPMYITAEYQLTFLHGSSSLLHANVQQGGCKTVVLGQGDIRVPTAAFWSLLARTHVIGNVHPASNAPGGLGPNDLQNAYTLPSATAGQGQTVAIVDANDDPNAEADMGMYRSTYGLPVCTTDNGCFQKVDQNGGTNYPNADQGWSGEIALDLDMVSAICPNCHIILAEGNSASFNDLGTAVDTAIRMGARIVSNSYGGPEDGQSAQAFARYYTHPGVIITVSAGDSGYGVQLPAAFKGVVAVGGTSLSRANTTRGWTEAVWSGTGSGCSRYVSKPAWQKDRGCRNRSVTDVAAVADPRTGVSVYNTYGGYGWGVYGGTSAAAPIIASTYALAGNAANVSSSYLYKHATSLNNVTSGSNGYCNQTYLCAGGPGYNGPTGLGTPNGLDAF